MAVIGDINLEESSTVTARLAAVQIERNSSVQSHEVMVLGSPNSTTLLALAEVQGATPTSTTAGLVVRPVGQYTDADVDAVPNFLNIGYDNGTNTMRVVSLTNKLPTRAYNSSFADFQAQITAPSTANSSNYLPVRITDGSSFLTPGNEYTDGSTTSTLAGPTLTFNNSSNNTMRTVGSTTPFPVHLRTSAGVELGVSTAAPAGTVAGLAVRPVFPALNSTTLVITSTHSTAIYPLISSVAAVRHKVFAYFVGSTHTNPSTLIFCSSLSDSGFDHWHVNFGSGSSGITGANLAIAPPAWIFQAIAANALNVKIEGGSSATSTVIARISLSWFDEA